MSFTLFDRQLRLCDPFVGTTNHTDVFGVVPAPEHVGARSIYQADSGEFLVLDTYAYAVPLSSTGRSLKKDDRAASFRVHHTIVQTVCRDFNDLAGTQIDCSIEEEKSEMPHSASRFSTDQLDFALRAFLAENDFSSIETNILEFVAAG